MAQEISLQEQGNVRSIRSLLGTRAKKRARTSNTPRDFAGDEIDGALQNCELFPSRASYATILKNK